MKGHWGQTRAKGTRTHCLKDGHMGTKAVPGAGELQTALWIQSVREDKLGGESGKASWVSLIQA